MKALMKLAFFDKLRKSYLRNRIYIQRMAYHNYSSKLPVDVKLAV